MNYRTATMLAKTDVGEAGTKDIEVKLRDIISRITIRWTPTKSKHGMDSYAYADISKIELKDGSDVLFGMDGGQAQALNIYDRKVPTMNFGEHTDGSEDSVVFGIDFGRFLFDPLLALDPSRFDNLILYITFDENVADTGVSANGLEIWADVFDEKVVSPMGFLSSKEHDSRTPPSSGYDYVKLPTDHPLRKLLLQGYRKGAYWPVEQISELRLDEDNEKRIPLDWDLEKYLMVMHGTWPKVVEHFYGVGDTGGTYSYYTTPTSYAAEIMVTVVGGDGYAGAADILKGGYFTLINSATAWAVGQVAGYLPNHCFEFPFGDQMDLDDWYDVTKVGDLRSRIKAGTGGANGTVAHILQQLRRY